MIAMLVILASTQATITPKTQACVCSNLLNQLDCQALNGCQWTPSNSTNSTNTATTALIGILMMNNLKELVLMLQQIQQPL